MPCGAPIPYGPSICGGALLSPVGPAMTPHFPRGARPSSTGSPFPSCPSSRGRSHVPPCPHGPFQEDGRRSPPRSQTRHSLWSRRILPFMGKTPPNRRHPSTEAATAPGARREVYRHRKWFVRLRGCRRLGAAPVCCGTTGGFGSINPRAWDEARGRPANAGGQALPVRISGVSHPLCRSTNDSTARGAHGDQLLNLFFFSCPPPPLLIACDHSQALTQPR
ncbi:uncharacterized protein WM294_013804 [Sarcoramphus papa]